FNPEYQGKLNFYLSRRMTCYIILHPFSSLSGGCASKPPCPATSSHPLGREPPIGQQSSLFLQSVFVSPEPIFFSPMIF
ncbi:MAG TPA: hypothetical protein PLB18_16855, partial [Acidobacteriota bacterium]|nr:hypothetical protein [Acidobacteriota bacterium]